MALFSTYTVLFAQQTCSSRVVSDETGYDSISPEDNEGLPNIPEPTDSSLVRVPGATYISRVVGPGTDDQFNSDGTLKFWQDYVSRHVVSSTAQITASGMYNFYTDSIEASAEGTLYVNGYPEKNIVITSIDEPVDQEGISPCIQISTEHLHFARLAPVGKTPGPNNQYAFV